MIVIILGFSPESLIGVYTTFYALIEGSVSGSSLKLSTSNFIKGFLIGSFPRDYKFRIPKQRIFTSYGLVSSFIGVFFYFSGIGLAGSYNGLGSLS